MSKQRENSVIYQQLRMVQLEKENNDKIYTRIFTSNKKNKVTPFPYRKASPTRTLMTYRLFSNNHKPPIFDTSWNYRISDYTSSVSTNNVLLMLGRIITKIINEENKFVCLSPIKCIIESFYLNKWVTWNSARSPFLITSLVTQPPSLSWPTCPARQ